MFSIGELVRWYETYANDDIVKDTGVGILLEQKDYPDYKIYKVFRIEKQDTVFLFDQDLTKLNE